MACAVPGSAWATPLGAADFEAMAGRCAPAVPAATLKAVARAESGLYPWALHDNTTGTTEKPENEGQAISDAWAWIGRGDSVDVGLMQINSANLSALGLTARTALDPCASLAGGAAVLQAAYGGRKTTADRQVALLMALSLYNTGSPLKGIMNGYARTVSVNAGSGDFPAPATQAQPVDTPVMNDPNAPPPWDISATGTYAEAHGAPWIVSLFSVSAITKQLQGQPVSKANETAAANVVATSSIEPSLRSP
jgi:type IV secretion system protein VirB1